MKKIEFKEVESKHLNANPFGPNWASAIAVAVVVAGVTLTIT